MDMHDLLTRTQHSGLSREAVWELPKEKIMISSWILKYWLVHRVFIFFLSLDSLKYVRVSRVKAHKKRYIYTVLKLSNVNTGSRIFHLDKKFTGRPLYACYCFGCQSCDAAKCAIQTVTLFHLFSSHGVPCGAVHSRVDGNLSERPNRLLLDGSTVHGGLRTHHFFFSALDIIIFSSC